MLQLLRVLFPSWKFFGEVGCVPDLWIRVSMTEGVEGEWLQWLKHRAPRKISQLFLNAKENEQLACYSLFVRCVQDLENKNSAEVSLALIERVAREAVSKLNPRAKSFQYKLRVENDDVYLSELKRCE